MEFVSKVPIGIEIDCLNSSSTKRINKKAIVESCKCALKGEKVASAEISVILIDDEQIHSMNKEFLQHDYATDVITFPLEDDFVVGEIYISVDTAKSQAEEYNVSLLNELKRLAIHGTLHLCGYDDATPEERKHMSNLEDKYLELA